MQGYFNTYHLGTDEYGGDYMFRKEGKKANHTAYDDRLRQWDWEKNNQLCQKHFGNTGQWWDNRSSGSIEAFLRDYYDDQELELVAIIRYKRNDGYYSWRFDFNSEKIGQ